MSSKRYPEEFKIEAVKQVTEKGHSGYYAWLKQPTSKTARKRQQS